jgi:hypothetical protein
VIPYRAMLDVPGDWFATRAGSGRQGADTGIKTPAENPLQKGTAPRELDDDQRTRRWAALQHITANPSKDHRHNPRHPRPHPPGAQIPGTNSLRSPEYE